MQAAPPAEVQALMPAGLELTEPAPTTVTVTVCCGVNVAVTALAAPTVSAQVEPEQSPENPAKTLPLAAVGVSVTLVPAAKLALQVAPQLMPAGLEAIEPLPVPARVTATGKVGVVQTLATPPEQTWGLVQLPQRVTVRLTPQLSAALTCPQFLPSRVQKAGSVSVRQVRTLRAESEIARSGALSALLETCTEAPSGPSAAGAV